ncbi:hypothetical protein, partial [Tepidiforma sp.]|uniref:hypothetical protein n=1 Tax=Tepidiforma sp. TaxID=2682230 RepID=UPI0025826DD7
MATTRVLITGARLREVIESGMSLYVTPGGRWPYWATAPKSAHDTCAATPRDVLAANGRSDVSALDDRDLLEVEVELLPARPWSVSEADRALLERDPDGMTPEELLKAAQLLREQADRYDALNGAGGGRLQRWQAEEYEARARETPEQRARRLAEAEA